MILMLRLFSFAFIYDYFSLGKRSWKLHSEQSYKHPCNTTQVNPVCMILWSAFTFVTRS